MSRFADLLRSIDIRLDLPKPTRARILLEIAADLEDLYEFYLERGLSEEKARALTEEKFDFSEKSLAELIAVHQSGLRSFMDRLSLQTQSRWEQAVVAALLLFTAAAGGSTFFHEDFFQQAGTFIWPVIGIGVAAGIVALTKFYHLFLRKERDPRDRRKGLPLLLLLSSASLLVGLYGFSVELYLALRKLAFKPEEVWLHVIVWLQKGSPVFLFGLTVTLVTAIFWFVLVHKVLSIERMEVDLLLTE